MQRSGVSCALPEGFEWREPLAFILSHNFMRQNPPTPRQAAGLPLAIHFKITMKLEIKTQPWTEPTNPQSKGIKSAS